MRDPSVHLDSNAKEVVAHFSDQGPQMANTTETLSVSRISWSRHVLAFLAYVLPTFPLGYVWHLVAFKDYYENLEVYRTDILIPFGVLAMTVQGVVWSIVYVRLFANERCLAGALKFAALAAPLAWSFLVVAVAAKHRMASVSGFVAVESAFTAIQYLVVSPLIALAYSFGRTR